MSRVDVHLAGLVAEQGLKRLDADDIGEPGNDDVGQFPRGCHQVQSVPDAYACLIQDGRPFP